jgi:hypothetical protein
MDRLLVLVLVLFVVGYAFAPLFKEGLPANTLRVFIVIYVTLFGLAIMFGPARINEAILVSDLFVSLGLTFFWSMRKKSDPSLLPPHSPLRQESQPLPSPHHPDK